MNVEQIMESVTAYGIRLLFAIAILVIGWFAAKLVKVLSRKLMERSNVEPTITKFVANLSFYVIMTFAIIAAIAKTGVQTTSFVAVIGATGLAIGLALQGSLSNFAAGFLIILFKPFKVGDFIEGAGVSGVVEQISMFTTEMKSPDNKKIYVPNAKITGDNIINYTAMDIRRIDLVIGVGYQDDLDKVINVLQALLAEDGRVLKDPAVSIGVLELADSSVNFAVRPWVKTDDYWDVYFDTHKKIKERFDAEGISIPYPQQDVHIMKEETA
jgi:small conductance mechanosensitive channel